MGEFAHKLDKIAQSRGGPTRLADLSGIARSIISRLITGATCQPDWETLAKLCRNLESSEIEPLLRAWLADNAAPDLKRYISISTDAPPLVAEDNGYYGDILSKLSDQTRITIEHLANMCLNDKDFAKMLFLVTKQWDEDWARRLQKDTEDAMAAATRATRENAPKSARQSQSQ